MRVWLYFEGMPYEGETDHQAFATEKLAHDWAKQKFRNYHGRKPRQDEEREGSDTPHTVVWQAVDPKDEYAELSTYWCVTELVVREK